MFRKKLNILFSLVIHQILFSLLTLFSFTLRWENTKMLVNVEMAQHTFSYSFSKAVLVCCSEVCTSEICVTRHVLHIIKKYKGTCLSKPGSWMLTQDSYDSKFFSVRLSTHDVKGSCNLSELEITSQWIVTGNIKQNE